MILKLCNDMLQDISRYRRNKDTIISESLKLRLDDSLDNYIKDLLKSSDYLNHRNHMKLLRKMYK